MTAGMSETGYTASGDAEESRVSVRGRLGQWDSTLASLSDQQKDCFIELGSTAANRPLPEHVSVLSIIVCAHFKPVILSLFSYPWKMNHAVLVRKPSLLS